MSDDAFCLRMMVHAIALIEHEYQCDGNRDVYVSRARELASRIIAEAIDGR